MGKVSSSFLWSAIERFSVQGIQFILSLIIARLVTPQDYGVVAMLTVFLSIAQIFVDSGFGNALIQKKDRTETDYSTVFLFNLLIGVISYFLLYVLSPYIGSFYKLPELILVTKIVGLNLIINSISLIPKVKLTISLNFKKQAFVSLIAVVVSGLIGICLAYKHYGYWALVVQTLINNVIQCILLWFYGRWYPLLKFSFVSLKELFSFGSKLLASALIDTVYQNIYTLVIGKKFSSNELGYYNRSFAFSTFPFTSFTNIITRVIYPMWCQKETVLKDSFVLTLRMMSYLIIPMSVFIFCMSNSIIQVVLTDAWLPMSSYMAILAVAYMFYPITAINDNVLKVCGRSDYFMKAEVVKKIFGCIILLLTVNFGVLVMCWGILLYMFIGCIINMFYTRKVIQVSILRQFLIIKDIVFINVLLFLSLKLLSTIISDQIWLFWISIGVLIPIYLMLSCIFHIKELQVLLSVIKK